VNTRTGSCSSLLGVGEGFGFIWAWEAAAENTSTKMIINERKLDLLH
jgi:hypothetical protein